MVKCCVVGCRNSYQKTRNRKENLFRFPEKNVTRCREWLQRVGWDELVYLAPKQLSDRYVCILHFLPEDIDRFNSRVLLKGDSYPQLLLPQQPLSDELVASWPPVCEDANPHVAESSPKKRPRSASKHGLSAHQVLLNQKPNNVGTSAGSEGQAAHSSISVDSLNLADWEPFALVIRNKTDYAEFKTFEITPESLYMLAVAYSQERQNGP